MTITDIFDKVTDKNVQGYKSVFIWKRGILKTCI